MTAGPLKNPAAQASRAVLPFRRALVLGALDNISLLVARALAAAGTPATVAGAGAGMLARLSRRVSRYAAVAPDEAALARPDDSVLARLVALAREDGADLIVPADVAGALCAARLAPLLPEAALFPCPDPASLTLLNDKWAFYELVQSSGLPTPPTRLLRSPADAAGLSLPAILKPLSDSGSNGIAVAQDEARLRARLRRGLPVVAQEFVPGREVSFALLADRGRLLAWTMHVRRPGGVIEFLDDPRVLELGRRVTELTGYTGMADIDLRYDDRDPGRVWVIEHNPRFWASFEYTTGLGVDFLERGLELAAGRPRPPLEKTSTGRVAGLKAAALALLGRGAPLEPASRAYLSRKLGDPLPELYRAAALAFSAAGRLFPIA